MNLTIQVPDAGFQPQTTVEVRRENMLHTRLAYGDDTGLLFVPGLLEVERVRYPGGEIPRRVQNDIPLDVALKQIITVVSDTFRRVEGDNGETYLERSIFSNDGRWQDRVPFWVTGKFDETINPPTSAPDRPPPDSVRRPFITEAPPQSAEMQRGTRTKNMTDATTAGGAP